MRWTPLLLLLLAAGCGGVKHVAARQAPAKDPRACTAAAPGFRTCFKPGIPSNPTIERRVGSTWAVVTGPLKPSEPSAEWGEISLSPDGRTLLAEWQYPCDRAAVFFVPARGGKPHLVTGESDWRKAPVAHALGWTRNGKARVQIYRSWHGHRIDPTHSRVFLFDPRARIDDVHPTSSPGC